MSGAGPLVEARDVVLSFGATPALQGADMAVARGEIVAVMGPSGSGSIGSASHSSTSSRPASVIEYRLRSGPAPGSVSPTSTLPSRARRASVEYTWPKRTGRSRPKNAS